MPVKSHQAFGGGGEIKLRALVDYVSEHQRAGRLQGHTTTARPRLQALTSVPAFLPRTLVLCATPSRVENELLGSIVTLS